MTYLLLETLTNSIVRKCWKGDDKQHLCDLIFWLNINVALHLVLSVFVDQTTSHLYVSLWDFEMRNNLNWLIECCLWALSRGTTCSIMQQRFTHESPAALVEWICVKTCLSQDLWRLSRLSGATKGINSLGCFVTKDLNSKDALPLCVSRVLTDMCCMSRCCWWAVWFTAFYSSQPLCSECLSVACWAPNKTARWVCPGDCCSQLITYKSLLASSLSPQVCSPAHLRPFALCGEWFRTRVQPASWLDKKPVELQCLRLEFKLRWHRTYSAANIRYIASNTLF